MNKFIAAAFAVFGLVAVTLAPIPGSLATFVGTTASADTYQDNVFPQGFPRAGRKPWLHEDRNVQMRHRDRGHHGGHMNRGGGMQKDGREIQVVRWRITRIVRGSAAHAPVARNHERLAGCGGGCVRPKPACGSRCNVKKPSCSTCRGNNVKQNLRQHNNAKTVVTNSPGANVVVIQNATAAQTTPGTGGSTSAVQAIAGYAPKTLTSWSCNGKPRGVPLACGTSVSPTGLCFCK